MKARTSISTTTKFWLIWMNKRNVIGIVILIAGIALIAAGVFRGELDVILRKAAVVCMECIGLG